MAWAPPPDVGSDFRAYLATEAKRKNCWIFSKTTKKWYTPEEFAFSNEDIHVHRGKASAPQLVLADPRYALDKANEAIEKANKFIIEHSKKMWEYYELKKRGT